MSMEPWAEAWQAAPGEVAAEVVAWMRSRPLPVQALMRRLPPACLVRGTRPLLCPAPGRIGLLYSYTEDGRISVLETPQGGIRGYCRPEWLEPVGWRYGLTPARVAAILDDPAAP
jgi:hypothetical protein